MPRNLNDTILGNNGVVYTAGKLSWIVFAKEFNPIKAKISIYVDYIDDKIEETQRDLFTEIESNYSNIIEKIFESILNKMTFLSTLKKNYESKYFEEHFQLIALDIRNNSRGFESKEVSDFLPQAKCILHYKTDLDKYNWFVRISNDYDVYTSGPED